MADIIDQYVRGYMDPPARRHRGRPMPRTKQDAPLRAGADDVWREIERIIRPDERFKLIMDTETLTGIGQPARIGCWQVRGANRSTIKALYRAGARTPEDLGCDDLVAPGLFYDPARLTPAEVDRVRAYADRHGYRCMTRDAFVARVLYKWVYGHGALLIGHNLVYDLGALCTHWGIVANGAYRNGFWMPLCGCGKRRCAAHPRILTKHQGRYKDRIGFGSTQDDDPGEDTPRFDWFKRGRFLDTATLGRALLGPGPMSLRKMGERFKADVLKWEDEPGHGGLIDDTYLDYAMNDVDATWALYRRERDLYRLHGLSRTITAIYSEASLLKAYLHDFGVPGFNPASPRIPKEILGYGMVAYYGGRTEVMHRCRPVEGMWLDFTSQYPASFALQGLQDLLLTERVDVRACADEIRAWLQHVSVEELRRPGAWRRLRVLVKIRPNGDLLLVRAPYGQDGTTIALAYVESGPPTWYALADVVYSCLRTGRVPEILEALELVPVGRIATQPMALFGNERYRIDPAVQDIAAGLINQRLQVQRDRDAAYERDDKAEGDYLEGLQHALKLLANSLYGVLAEVNPDEPVENAVRTIVYGMEAQQVTTRVVERPGPYFAGPLAALVTAGGRLLLGLAETLALERGIGHVVTDTDSIVLARPGGMPREVFQQHVRDVADWFLPLSPFEGSAPFLKIEDYNYAVTPDGKVDRMVLEPLWVIPVSSKRYVAYNRLPEGSVRIRKFSSHGVGTWQGREGYRSPAHVPEPWCDVGRLANGAGERWMYDLWYDFIMAMEFGATHHHVRRSEWIDLPAYYRVTISTGQQARRYCDLPHLRPYTFFSGLPPLDRNDIARRTRMVRPGEREMAQQLLSLEGVPFYSPYASSVEKLHDIRRADTHEVVHIQHKTLAECLKFYFVHPEWNAANPDSTGPLTRRRVRVLRHVLCGKETSRVLDDEADETDGTLVNFEEQVFAAGGMREALRQYRIRDLMAATGLPRQTLYDLMDGAEPAPPTLETIRARLARLASTATLSYEDRRLERREKRRTVGKG